MKSENESSSGEEDSEEEEVAQGLSIQETRKQNMKRNQDIMIGIGFDKEEPKPKKVAPKVKKVTVKMKTEPRRSTRLVASAPTEEGKQAKLEFEQREQAEKIRIAEEKAILRHSTKKVILKVTKTSGTVEGMSEVFDFLGEYAESREKVEEIELKSSEGVDLLRKELNLLKLRGNLVKLTPERSYTLLAHPTTEKTILFSGDKTGTIGMAVWNQDQPHPTTWSWESHDHHAVTSLKLDPINSQNLYSAGYDKTARRLNFETNKSEEVVDLGSLKLSKDPIISSIDISKDGNMLWLSDNAGGVSFRDLRERKDNTKRFDIDDGKKISGLALHPIDSNLLLTTHLSREMRIYDIRKLSGKGSVEKAQLSSHETGKSCTAAYFDRTGTKIVSTSYDDKIRIFTSKNFASEPEIVKPFKTINHNNQTGRWVTVLKAQWSLNPNLSPHFTIGGMDGRTLDVFSGVTGEKVAAFKSEETTAVPAATTSHPSLPIYFGATAAGKVSCFAAPLEGEEEEEDGDEDEDEDGMEEEED